MKEKQKKASRTLLWRANGAAAAKDSKPAISPNDRPARGRLTIKGGQVFAGEKPARRPPRNKASVSVPGRHRGSLVWSISTHCRWKTAKHLALFDLAIVSTLRGCDGVAVRSNEVAPSG